MLSTSSSCCLEQLLMATDSYGYHQAGDGWEQQDKKVPFWCTHHQKQPTAANGECSNLSCSRPASAHAVCERHLNIHSTRVIHVVKCVAQRLPWSLCLLVSPIPYSGDRLNSKKDIREVSLPTSNIGVIWALTKLRLSRCWLDLFNLDFYFLYIWCETKLI